MCVGKKQRHRVTGKLAAVTHEMISCMSIIITVDRAHVHDMQDPPLGNLVGTLSDAPEQTPNVKVTKGKQAA